MNKTIKEVKQAFQHYEDGLLSRAETIAICLVALDKERNQILSEAKHNFETLGMAVPE